MQAALFTGPQPAPRRPAVRRSHPNGMRPAYEFAYPVRHEESARHPMEEEIERWDGMF